MKLRTLLFPILVAGSMRAAESSTDRIQRVENGLPPAIVVEGHTTTAFSIQERMRFYKTPGVSVAVIDGGVLAWARGYGICESGGETRVTPETLFQAGSISKPIAALLALSLVQDSTLSLDQDVNDKLVSWKVPGNEFTRERKVTLRGLLSHSAGLTDDAGFAGFAVKDPVPSLADILSGQQPVTPNPVRVGYPPGTRTRYSGGGYCVMQQLLMDVSGKPFPDLANERVLTPLGMTQSVYQQPLSPERTPLAAAGHRTDGQPIEGKWRSYPYAPAGLWTTPSDLARFVLEIQESYAGRSNKILSQSLTKEMLTRQVDDWGLGFSLANSMRAARFSHSGSAAGYECNLEAYVEIGQGAVVMTNSTQGWRLAREILWSIAKEYNWPGYPYAPERKPVVQVNAAILGDYVGAYRFATDADVVITVTRDGERLFASTGGAGNTELYPQSDRQFFVIEDTITLTFVRDTLGRVSEIQSDQGWKATRIPSGPPQ
jgi:CubicO group peptidase (beta-lactamase class C family)